MSKFTRIAALTGLVAVLAGPAFAGDQDSQTLLRDSGLYVAEAGSVGHANAADQGKAVKSQQPSAYDFQLDGR